MKEIMLLVDLITVGMGAALIVVPNKVYNWGRKGEHKVPPPSWNWVGRIIGVVAVGLGGLFLYLDWF